MREPTKIKRKTVSLPSEIHDAGLKRAAADRRDFSNYIAVLIEADVRRAQEGVTA